MLLLYDIYTEGFKYLGLIIKLYNICIANSFIEENQCKITWYFNGIKVSQVQEKVNTKIIEKIAEHFDELALSQKEHKCLVMGIEFLENGKLLLFMKDYIGESITLFDKNIDATVSSPLKKVYKM